MDCTIKARSILRAFIVAIYSYHSENDTLSMILAQADLLFFFQKSIEKNGSLLTSEFSIRLKFCAIFFVFDHV